MAPEKSRNAIATNSEITVVDVERRLRFIGDTDFAGGQDTNCRSL